MLSEKQIETYASQIMLACIKYATGKSTYPPPIAELLTEMLEKDRGLDSKVGEVKNDN